MAFSGDYMKTPGGILKVVEILFVLVSFGILRACFEDFNLLGLLTVDCLFFGVGSTVCCMIVTPLLLIVYLNGNMELQQTIMEVTLNFVFSFLLITFGGISMDRCTEKTIFDNSTTDKGIAMASFAILAGIVYLADCVVAAMKYRR